MCDAPKCVTALNERFGAGHEDDEAVVQWLIREHSVCLIPGSACGAPGATFFLYMVMFPLNLGLQSLKVS